jgi:hypothetical protein
MFSKLIATAAAILVVGAASASAAETPLGLKADGLRWQGLASLYSQQPTALGLKADGLRWNATARFYSQRSAAAQASKPSSFDWGDAGIGAAGGIAVLLAAGGAIVFARHSRRTKLAL